MSMKDEGGLGLAVHWVQQALISAFEDNCPLRPVKKGRKFLRWTSELESLRREVRQLFNKCRGDNPHSWELYREAQRNCRKPVRKASKNAWGPSIAPLMTYLGQLGYIGLFLQTLNLSWDLWWLLRIGVRSSRGKLWSPC